MRGNFQKRLGFRLAVGFCPYFGLAVLDYHGSTQRVGERLADLAGHLAGVDSNLRLSLRDIAWQDSQLSEGHVDLTLVRGALSLTRAVGVLGDGLRTELSGSATVAGRTPLR